MKKTKYEKSLDLKKKAKKSKTQKQLELIARARLRLNNRNGDKKHLEKLNSLYNELLDGYTSGQELEPNDLNWVNQILSNYEEK